MALTRSRTAIAALLVVGMACSGGRPACVDATVAREARVALEVEAGQIDFAPVLPCGPGRGFVVGSVVGDTLPGTPPARRISFIVERNGERSYVFSGTRAAIGSSQIPQGTRRFSVSAGPAVAEGFIGPAGGGGEMAYLRWRTDGVTYELDASLGRALDEADVRQIATALMLRGSTAERRAPATPSSGRSERG